MSQLYRMTLPWCWVTKVTKVGSQKTSAVSMISSSVGWVNITPAWIVYKCGNRSRERLFSRKSRWTISGEGERRRRSTIPAMTPSTTTLPAVVSGCGGPPPKCGSATSLSDCRYCIATLDSRWHCCKNLMTKQIWFCFVAKFCACVKILCMNLYIKVWYNYSDLDVPDLTRRVIYEKCRFSDPNQRTPTSDFISAFWDIV